MKKDWLLTNLLSLYKLRLSCFVQQQILHLNTKLVYPLRLIWRYAKKGRGDLPLSITWTSIKWPMRLDSRFAAVFADPSDLSTVKAADRCLKVSVSCPAPPPDATSNSWRRSTIEACVFPEPDAPETITACGYPDSPCNRTASWTTRPVSNSKN